MRPRLKPYLRRVEDGRIELTRELGLDTVIEDPDGTVQRLLDLCDGSRTVAEIAPAIGLSPEAVAEGVAALDAAALLEDADATTTLSEDARKRYATNLAFFGTYARLDRSRFALQEAVCGARVLLLGVGGLGSTLLLNLAGLGVGSIVLVDHDAVDLSNFSRQFLYRTAELGESKVTHAVERAQSFNPTISVEGVEQLVSVPDDVDALLAGGFDLVLCAIDRPAEIRYWVNQSCVRRGVPFVTGGQMVGRGLYYSIEPDRSACLACNLVGDVEWGPWRYDRAAAAAREAGIEPTNRTIGPTASVLGGLVALEALRFLSRFAEPVAAGKLWLVDSATGEVELGYGWERNSGCPICGDDRVDESLPPLEIIERAERRRAR